MSAIAVAADRVGQPRACVSLDGPWRFRFGDGAWRTANVPNPWGAEFADLRERSGTAVYERDLDIPADWRGRALVVRFGAVNYLAEVFLNGVEIGRHEGGYLPFECVPPETALGRENVLTVRVTQPSADPAAYPDHPFAEIPHGKQSWYGPLGGIWQSVALEARHPSHILDCAVTPDATSGAVAVALEIARPEGAELVVAVRDPAGALVAERRAPAGARVAVDALAVPAPALWSPDTPDLYTIEATLEQDGAVIDTMTRSFGFRTIETRDGRFYLNGEPFYMRGALDQDYYPEGICTPPSVAFLEDQFAKAKALGLNLLRCHIKVPDPRYYEVADRMGMLIWTEIPNVAAFSAAAARRMRETMQAILKRDAHHPSIIAWTIINEDWGTRLVENADHRVWLKAEYDWLKAADPTRLVVDNSACVPNFHVKTDINDYHYYRSVPERRAEWDALTEAFAAGADWTFSPHGDAERRGDEPLVVSEFGVWGLPQPAQLRKPDGSEPFWFESGPGWGDGAAYPHGIETRFDLLHLDRVFGTFEDFIEAVQWYQHDNLKYQIESMRARPSIQGYVITEITDVHWESNGLLDMDRNPRVFHDVFAHFNADLVIVPQADRHACTGGETVTLTLGVATGGIALAAGARLSWHLEGAETASLMLPAIDALAARTQTVAIAMPAVETARRLPVRFVLEAEGKVLARNELPLSVYPPRAAAPAVALAAPDAGVAAYLDALGYRVGPPDAADVVVVRALDSEDIEAMRHGARYLVLADGTAATHRNLRTDAPPREQPFIPILDDVPGLPMGADAQLPNIGLVPRHGTMWRGDWIASFSWLGRSGAFAALPGGPLLDLSFDAVVPHHVLTGFRPWEYEGLVHAGLVVGWCHKPAATIARRQVGKGSVLASTFRVMAGAAGEDPVATALLDALVITASEMAVAP